ncbi:hypothetical protein evm_014759 [Chilo suppressalis]|nr:hypothetical protein evm_014759 [Chilo suppressalis]
MAPMAGGVGRAASAAFTRGPPDVSWLTARRPRVDGTRRGGAGRVPGGSGAIMKKKHNSGHTKRKSTKLSENNESEKQDKVEAKVDTLDDEEQGFGGWLKSTDGIETMKLFVIANTIVMLTTIVYPHIQTAYQIIYDMIYGPDTLY